jgi:hypothetical protein
MVRQALQVKLGVLRISDTFVVGRDFPGAFRFRLSIASNIACNPPKKAHKNILRAFFEIRYNMNAPTSSAPSRLPGTLYQELALENALREAAMRMAAPTMDIRRQFELAAVSAASMSAGGVPKALHPALLRNNNTGSLRERSLLSPQGFQADFHPLLSKKRAIDALLFAQESKIKGNNSFQGDKLSTKRVRASSTDFPLPSLREKKGSNVGFSSFRQCWGELSDSPESVQEELFRRQLQNGKLPIRGESRSIIRRGSSIQTPRSRVGMPHHMVSPRTA